MNKFDRLDVIMKNERSFIKYKFESVKYNGVYNGEIDKAGGILGP